MKQNLPFFKITYAFVGLLFLFSSASSAKNGAFLSKNTISPLLRTATCLPADSISTKGRLKQGMAVSAGKSYANKQDKLLVAGPCELQTQTFPTSPASGTAVNGNNTNTLSGWTVGGTYVASPWDSSRGRIALTGVGLMFQRDGGSVSSVQKAVTVPANITLVLNNIGWLNNSTNTTNAATSTLQVILNGVVYATISTGVGYNNATVTTANSASASSTLLAATSSSSGQSAAIQLQLTLPNAALTNAQLEFKFTAGSSATDCDDIFFSGITINKTPPAAPTIYSKVDPSCTSTTGTINLSTPTPTPLYSMDGGAYQTSATFSGLAASSTHTFKSAYAGYTGCESTALSVTIGAIKIIPVANAGNDFTINCTTATSVAIGSTAVGGVTYSWAATTGTPPTVANPTVSPTATTTYTLTATNNGSTCTATDAVVVTVDKTAPAVPTLSGTTITNCPAASVNLNSLVSDTTNLKWYKESTHTTEVTTPTAVTTSGTYFPFYLATNGCYSSPTSTGVTATIINCCAAQTAPDLTN